VERISLISLFEDLVVWWYKRTSNAPGVAAIAPLNDLYGKCPMTGLGTHLSTDGSCLGNDRRPCSEGAGCAEILFTKRPFQGCGKLIPG
jgi:hypothetical protein